MATSLTEQRKAVDTEKPFIEQYDSAVRKGDKARVERMEQVGPETYRDTLHKRGEYGAVMDDNQYSAMKEDEASFNEQIGGFKSKIKGAQGLADKQYKEQSGEINAAHLGVPDFESFYSKWVAENTTPVSIYNGDSYEGTYILDNDSFGKFMDVVADTGFYRVFKDSEGQWRINNRGYGKELHEPLYEYVNKLKPTVQAAYDREVGTAQQALDIQKEGAMSALNTSYGAANQSLSQQREQVGQLQSNYISNISNIRFKYQNKLKGMSSTVKGLFS